MEGWRGMERSIARMGRMILCGIDWLILRMSVSNGEERRRLRDLRGITMGLSIPLISV